MNDHNGILPSVHLIIR